jgi:hypothetical protein
VGGVAGAIEACEDDCQYGGYSMEKKRISVCREPEAVLGHYIWVFPAFPYMVGEGQTDREP